MHMHKNNQARFSHKFFHNWEENLSTEITLQQLSPEIQLPFKKDLIHDFKLVV